MPTDNAGNTLGTARDISLISAMSFTDRVDALDPNDYYRFTLTSRSSVNLTLANLSANADLQLLNSSGTVLQASQNSNAMTDLIIALLDPGTYYVRVFPGSGSAGTDYSLSTSAYTGSRQIELFWRDASSGANGLWHMGGTNNTTIASLSALNAVATNWQIDAIADFNQDGIPDLVWRDYANGSNGIWLMGGSNNDTILSIASLAAMSTNWRLEGVADFNGDNRPDLVWRDYTQGYNQIWFMGGTNNTTIASTTGLSQVSTNWGIDAVADMNGDNRPDLVWRESTQGAMGVWFMGGTNNTTIASTAALNPVSINWHLEGIADFNQDDHPDFVWRDYTSGNNGIWLMGGTNNTAIVSTVALSPVAGSWRMTPFTRSNQLAPIDGAGNSTTTALNIGSLSGNAVFRETVHRSDGNDYYRFSIDATSNFNLTLNEQNVVNADANVQLWDAYGNLIQQSFSGTSTESISRTLNPGTYYIRVYQSASETTNYTLNLSATMAIPSPDLRGSFFDVTPEPLNTGSSFTTNFRVLNAGSSSAGAFRVGFYLSSDSTITTSDRLLSFYDITSLAAGLTTSTLSTSLALPGVADSFWSGSSTYYIGMIVDSLNTINENNESNNANLGNGIDWDDVLVQVPFITVAAPNGGNSLVPGSSYTISWSDNISENVRIDLYRGTSYVNTIATSVLSTGSYTWAVPTTGLTFANDYRIRISSVNNSSLFDDSNAAFTIVPIDSAPNTIATARTITVGSTSTTLSDWVGTLDSNDYYRFTLSTLSNFSLLLNGLSADADVALLNASGGVIRASTAAGSTAESMTQQLGAGTYYIRVYPYSGDTTYNLSVAATVVSSSIDLWGTFFDVTPEPLTAGNSYIANFQLQNTGSANAGAFRVGFYLSTDSAITTSDRLLTSYDIAALSAGASTTTLSRSFTLPGSTDPFWLGNRTYYIGIIIDILNAIVETNETNNSNRGNAIDWDDVAITVNQNSIDPTPALFNLTSNQAIDALLAPSPYNYYWNTSANGGVITYSFYRNTSGAYYGTETVSEVSDAIKTNVRMILTSLEAYLNIRFVEVADTTSSYGVLRYMFSSDPTYAYAYYPSSDRRGGDVHLTTAYENDSNNRFSGGYGTHGFMSLVHETLHALGLKHPGNYNGSGTGSGPFLTGGVDNTTNTVMSYNFAGNSAITPMAYDLRALQYLYGARSNNASATTYNFSTVFGYTVNSQLFGSTTTALKQTIWDSGGTDTLDFSGLSTSSTYRFDLREGGMLTTQAAYAGTTYTDRSGTGSFTTTTFGTAIAYNTIIENLVNSRSNDYIIASSANNIFSGYTVGTATGSDVIEGGSSVDVLALAGYTLATLTATVVGTDLTIGLGSFGSVLLKNYYGTNGNMRILVGGSYYTYTGGRWIVTTAPSEPAMLLADHETGGLTATAPVLSAESPVAIACQCPNCLAQAGWDQLGETSLLEKVV